MKEIKALIKEGRRELIALVPREVTNKFCKLRDKLELGFAFHNLRHYYASHLLLLNIPDKYYGIYGAWVREYIKKCVSDLFNDKKNETKETVRNHINSIIGK